VSTRPPGGDSSGKPLSRLEAVGLLAHRFLDRWLSPLSVWMIRRTRGAAARPWKAKVLVLTARGRRTGKKRSVVMQYFPDGEDMIVAAANDGGQAHPGWYYNLIADPAPRVEVDGRQMTVQPVELPEDEAARWWERIVQKDPNYGRYARATNRRIPVLRLAPVESPRAAGPTPPAAERPC